MTWSDWMSLCNRRKLPQPQIHSIRPWFALLLALLPSTHRAMSQTTARAAQQDAPYNLSLSVDEVGLTLHAADTHGLPINDLKLDELRLLDNGKPPIKILSFYSLQDHSIRAGILIDTSESMERDLPANRAIALQYVQLLLRQQTDQAFVIDFGFVSKIKHSWSSDPAALSASIRNIAAGQENPLGGTAIFDTIFHACFSEFGKIDHAASGNFIMLFSDGEDNASHTSLQETVDMCQRSHTAIYAFRPDSSHGISSTGPRTLADLTSETGGKVFYNDSSEVELSSDLHIIEANLRNQYRLIYKPAELKHDGSFHRIVLTPSDGSGRINSILTRSGYYAPGHE